MPGHGAVATGNPETKARDRLLRQFIREQCSHIIHAHQTLIEAVQKQMQLVVALAPPLEVFTLEKRAHETETRPRRNANPPSEIRPRSR